MGKSKITRRSFVVMAGLTGFAALACRRSMKAGEKLIPYINPPDYPKPGDWAFYSTTCRECPAGCGMLMWHRDGRVTKAEGNPMHPVNEGRLCIRGQASVQGEYGPGRIKNVLEKDLKGGWIDTSWELAVPAIRNILQSKKPVIISGLETGTLAGVIEDFASGFSTKPVWYEAFNYESLRTAGKEVYGMDLIPRFDISGCDLILSFNADFLETWLSPVEYTGEFADIHSPDGKIPGKLIYFGYSENLTAMNADEFIITEPGSHTAILNNIALNIRNKGAIRNKQLASAVDNLKIANSSGIDEKLIERISSAIINAKAPVILAGRGNDSSVEGVSAVKAAYLLNEILGNRQRIDFSQYHALSGTAYSKDIRDLFGSLTNDNVVVIHNSNPVYTEPGFGEYLKSASAVIYIGPEANETSALANYVLPSHFPLEDWGDYEPWKGTISFIQPVMRPLYNSWSAGDIFNELAKNKKSDTDFSTLARNNREKWSSLVSSPEQNMKSSHVKLHPAQINVSFSFPIEAKNEVTIIQKGSLFIDPVPSLFFYDGRLANRSWLQEIPDPVSDIVWQNSVDMNVNTAASMGIRDGEIVTVKSSAGTIDGPVRLTGQISENVISIRTGQGHWYFGEAANGKGVNVFSVIASEYSDPLTIVKIEKSAKINPPVYPDHIHEQYGRDILKAAQYDKILKETITMPLPEGYLKDRDLYASHDYPVHRWAMVIDLQRCIGCKACVAACYAENNIPVVGKKNCEKGLEMAWLKVPSYKTQKDKTAFLPLPCQHCDAAPCEPVCPVYASSHTPEGLNAQIYNRCVGTRYCSNNCPYKVRRFNWKNIDHEYPETLQLNPEVTVRCRGVMEKCTFCVQRIRNAEYSALKNNRTMKDGDVVPACAQTCPAGAIVFGDLLDHGSHVSVLFNHERRYQLLKQLNTKPAVVYLKKIILDI